MFDVKGSRIDKLLGEYGVEHLQRKTNFPVLDKGNRPIILRAHGAQSKRSGLVQAGRVGTSHYVRLVTDDFLCGRPISDTHGSFGDPLGQDNSSFSALHIEKTDDTIGFFGLTAQTGEWNRLANEVGSEGSKVFAGKLRLFMGICVEAIEINDQLVVPAQTAAQSLLEAPIPTA